MIDPRADNSRTHVRSVSMADKVVAKENLSPVVTEHNGIGATVATHIAEYIPIVRVMRTKVIYRIIHETDVQTVGKICIQPIC